MAERIDASPGSLKIGPIERVLLVRQIDAKMEWLQSQGLEFTAEQRKLLAERMKNYSPRNIDIAPEHLEILQTSLRQKLEVAKTVAGFEQFIEDNPVQRSNHVRQLVKMIRPAMIGIHFMEQFFDQTA